jgi:hypothetical protein
MSLKRFRLELERAEALPARVARPFKVVSVR